MEDPLGYPMHILMLSTFPEDLYSSTLVLLRLGLEIVLVGARAGPTHHRTDDASTVPAQEDIQYAKERDHGAIQTVWAFFIFQVDKK